MIAEAYNTVSSSSSGSSSIITSQMGPITSSGSSVLSTNGGWGIVDGTWTNVSKVVTEIKGPIKVGDTEISNKLFEIMIKDFLSTAKEKYPEEFLKE